MKRIAMFLFLLGIILSIVGTVFAEGGNPDASATIRITITPTQGEPGTQIAVSGTGANPELMVYVSLASQTNPGAGELTSVVVDSDSLGSFNATLIVPGGITDGPYFVRAEQFLPGGDVLQYYWKGFSVGTGGEAGAEGGGGVNSASDEESLMPETGEALGTPSSITMTLALLLVVGMVTRGLYTVVTRKS